MEISMPEFMGCGPIPVNSMPHITLIVSPQNKVYVYENSFWQEGKVAYRVFENESKQLEKYLRQLAMKAGKVENRKTGVMQDALSVWIKPEDSASYEDVIAALDMVRNLNIRQYGLADITENDIDFLKKL
jgi:biopolymer transport protein ExbD